MYNFETTRKQFDLIIIGSGGSGLMAAISAIEDGVKNVAIISKVIPTNSHTVAAKGGINASLGNVVADDWRWHAFDTIKGSDYLADEDAVNLLCKNAKNAILTLEKMGMVFSRDEKGQIAQRAYGGQTSNFGEGEIAYRACYSKDKTGQSMLYSLYGEALKHGVKFFSEFFVVDLLLDQQNQCYGCLAIDLNLGELVIFESKITIIASGGYSQIYKNTTSSLICTGDGGALVIKAELPLKDMEFIQFHPTGIANQGFLISEAARGEGAHLLNCKGDRFMKNYAPKMMELSSRDVISRAIAMEIIAGRGCGENKDSVFLDLTFLSDEVLNSKLPGVIETAKNFAKIDVKKSPIKVAPTAHYTMGGVPVNLNCEVLDFAGEAVKGLMAIGEAACISVHGANRLGCNSLLDLIVFGEIAGKQAAKNILSINFDNKIIKIAEEKIIKLKNLLEKNSINELLSLSEIKINLQNINEKHLGVFRNKDLLESGFKRVNELFKKFKNYNLKNKSLLFNDELILYYEIENLFLNSIVAIYCAMNRQESRGAHYRQDFELKDDENFRFHSLAKITNSGEILLKKDPVK